MESESLSGGPGREAQLLTYTGGKYSPPLSGQVILFDEAHSFGREAHGALREGGDTHRGSQTSRSNPDDQRSPTAGIS